MEICSNCFKEIPQKYPFCPFCGCPTLEIGLKQCTQGHIIYETCRTCPICGQITNLGKSMIDRSSRGTNPSAAHANPTEILSSIPGGMDNRTILEEDSGKTRFETEFSGNKTIMENNFDGDKTRFEESFDYGKTRMETFNPDDKTRLEEDPGKTILDENMFVETPSQPFFAWIVFLSIDGKPGHDIRLKKDKMIIGKGSDADIRFNDDFISKLHALIYYEEGQFYLTDLGSTNHTYLNEKKVIKEVLNDGDCIRIGRQKMLFACVKQTL